MKVDLPLEVIAKFAGGYICHHSEDSSIYAKLHEACEKTVRDGEANAGSWWWVIRALHMGSTVEADLPDGRAAYQLRLNPNGELASRCRLRNSDLSWPQLAWCGASEKWFVNATENCPLAWHLYEPKKGGYAVEYQDRDSVSAQCPDGTWKRSVDIYDVFATEVDADSAITERLMKTARANEGKSVVDGLYLAHYKVVHAPNAIVTKGQDC